MARWHYLDPPLVWSLTAAYAAHLAEESLAGEGLRFWIARLSGAPVPLGVFVLANLVMMSLFLAGAVAATTRKAPGWAVIAMAALLLLNALLHLGGTLLTRHYSPGLVTAMVAYVPIGGLVLMRAMTQAPHRDQVVGLLAAVLAHAAVIAVAFGAPS